jgi:hypothetical protein
MNLEAGLLWFRTKISGILGPIVYEQKVDL